MFVQVFEAKVSDGDLWNRQCAKWRAEIKPLTKGFRGYSSGVTADGDMITMARFTSAEAAQVDSGLPEQGDWFEATSKAFDGDVTFHDCNEVDVLLGGPTTDAGFVQIIRGRAKDQQEMRRRMKALEPGVTANRPDLVGGLTAWHGDGAFTHAVFFASEAEARRHEKDGQPTAWATEMASLVEGALMYLDLTEPDLV